MILLSSLRRHAALRAHERFQQAIKDIDREIANTRATAETVPFELYRMRRVLEDALRSCGFASDPASKSSSELSDP